MLAKRLAACTRLSTTVSQLFEPQLPKIAIFTYPGLHFLFALGTPLWQLRKTLHKWKDNSVLAKLLAACTHYACTLLCAMFRTKISGGLGKGCIQKLGPILISATVETSNFKFGIQLGFGTILPKKTTFRTTIGGAGGLTQGSIRKKIGTPCLFLQPLKLATEKLVHNMSSGLPCQTQVLFK